MTKVVQPQSKEECRACCEELYPLSVKSTVLLNRIWGLAYEAGHANGYHQIASCYCDFVEAAEAGICAGRLSHGALND